VKKLPRTAGLRESRYAHLLSGDVAVEDGALEPAPSRASGRDEVAERIAALEQELAQLRREFEDFRGRFE